MGTRFQVGSRIGDPHSSAFPPWRSPLPRVPSAGGRERTRGRITSVQLRCSGFQRQVAPSFLAVLQRPSLGKVVNRPPTKGRSTR